MEVENETADTLRSQGQRDINFDIHGLLLTYSSRAQTLMKGRLKGAQTGHSLLKKKADALQFRFRAILNKIIQVRKSKSSSHLLNSFYAGNGSK